MSVRTRWAFLCLAAAVREHLDHRRRALRILRIVTPGNVGVPPCAPPREGAEPLTPGSAPIRVARLFRLPSLAVQTGTLGGFVGTK